jgi:hypothetical protein
MLPTSPGRPERLAFLACGDRDGGVPKPGECFASATSGRYEFAAASFDGVHDKGFLARKTQLPWHVLERLDSHHAVEQQLFHHIGSTFLGLGGLPRLLHSRR